MQKSPDPHGDALWELGLRKPKKMDDNEVMATAIVTCPLSFT